MKNFHAHVSQTFLLDEMANLPVSKAFLLNSETFLLNEILRGSVKILCRVVEMDGGSVEILRGSVDGTFLLNEILSRVDSEEFSLDSESFLLDEKVFRVYDFFSRVDEKVFGIDEKLFGSVDGRFGSVEIKFGSDEKVFGKVDTDVLFNEIFLVSDCKVAFCNDFFISNGEVKSFVDKILNFCDNGSFLRVEGKNFVDDLLVKVVIFLLCNVKILGRVCVDDEKFISHVFFSVPRYGFGDVGDGFLVSEVLRRVFCENCGDILVNCLVCGGKIVVIKKNEGGEDDTVHYSSRGCVVYGRHLQAFEEEVVVESLFGRGFGGGLRPSQPLGCVKMDYFKYFVENFPVAKYNESDSNIFFVVSNYAFRASRPFPHANEINCGVTNKNCLAVDESCGAGEVKFCVAEENCGAPNYNFGVAKYNESDSDVFFVASRPFPPANEINCGVTNKNCLAVEGSCGAGEVKFCVPEENCGAVGNGLLKTEKKSVTPERAFRATKYNESDSHVFSVVPNYAFVASRPFPHANEINFCVTNKNCLAVEGSCGAGEVKFCVAEENCDAVGNGLLKTEKKSVTPERAFSVSRPHPTADEVFCLAVEGSCGADEVKFCVAEENCAAVGNGLLKTEKKSVMPERAFPTSKYNESDSNIFLVVVENAFVASQPFPPANEINFCVTNKNCLAVEGSCGAGEVKFCVAEENCAAVGNSLLKTEKKSVTPERAFGVAKYNESDSDVFSVASRPFPPSNEINFGVTNKNCLAVEGSCGAGEVKFCVPEESCGAVGNGLLKTEKKSVTPERAFPVTKYSESDSHIFSVASRPFPPANEINCGVTNKNCLAVEGSCGADEIKFCVAEENCAAVGNGLLKTEKKSVTPERAFRVTKYNESDSHVFSVVPNYAFVASRPFPPSNEINFCVTNKNCLAVDGSCGAGEVKFCVAEENCGAVGNGLLKTEKKSVTPERAFSVSRPHPTADEVFCLAVEGSCGADEVKFCVPDENSGAVGNGLLKTEKKSVTPENAFPVAKYNESDSNIFSVVLNYAFRASRPFPPANEINCGITNKNCLAVEGSCGAGEVKFCVADENCAAVGNSLLKTEKESVTPENAFRATKYNESDSNIFSVASRPFPPANEINCGVTNKNCLAVEGSCGADEVKFGVPEENCGVPHYNFSGIGDNFSVSRPHPTADEVNCLAVEGSCVADEVNFCVADENCAAVGNGLLKTEKKSVTPERDF